MKEVFLGFDRSEKVYIDVSNFGEKWYTSITGIVFSVTGKNIEI